MGTFTKNPYYFSNYQIRCKSIQFHVYFAVDINYKVVIVYIKFTKYHFYNVKFACINSAIDYATVD